MATTYERNQRPPSRPLCARVGLHANQLSAHSFVDYPNTPVAPPSTCARTADGASDILSDASTDTGGDSDDASEEDSNDGDISLDVPENSILADTQAMLDLMVRTWEPILGALSTQWLAC